MEESTSVSSVVMIESTTSNCSPLYNFVTFVRNSSFSHLPRNLQPVFQLTFPYNTSSATGSTRPGPETARAR